MLHLGLIWQLLHQRIVLQVVLAAATVLQLLLVLAILVHRLAQPGLAALLRVKNSEIIFLQPSVKIKLQQVSFVLFAVGVRSMVKRMVQRCRQLLILVLYQTLFYQLIWLLVGTTIAPHRLVHHLPTKETLVTGIISYHKAIARHFV